MGFFDKRIKQYVEKRAMRIHIQFRYTNWYWILFVCILLFSTSLIRNVHSIQKDVLDLNHNNNLIDLLFPTTDPLTIHVFITLCCWLFIGFGIEFTHRYRNWHRIIDLSTIIIVVIICWILYQQYAMSQLSVNTILQILLYLFLLFLGGILGYVINRFTTKHES